MTKKIAFLFLTLDDVNFPKIWEIYFKGNEDKYTIYCHPKFPEKVTIEWMKSNIINNLVPTGWGYIVNAYHNLLAAASANPDNYKFVTISESCLPLAKFNVFYDEMFRDDIRTSYIKFMKISAYDWNQRIKVNPGYEKYNFIKHYARFCLSRYHVEKLLIKTADFDFFGKMHIGDEFFLTMLNDNDTDEDYIKGDYIKDFAVTYDNWDYVSQQRAKANKKLKKMYRIMDTTKNAKLRENIKKDALKLITIRDDFSRNPKSYVILTPSDIKEAKQLNNFFWRKFPKTSDIEKYYKIDDCCID